MKFKLILCLLPISLLLACSSDSGTTAATTYTISGTLNPSASSSSVKSTDALQELNDILRPFARTQCSDGYFYSVYCLSFSSPPVAAEGDVDCSGSGGFSVAGLPLNEPVGCFVRRYPDASSTSAETVGSIEIPAATLSGSTDTMVSSGDVNLSVSIDSSGTISATVVSGTVNETPNTDASSAFTAANINGEWTLACTSSAGGSTFSAGLCKCFLSDYPVASYSNQDDCMNDSSGAGAAITGTVSMGIGMYVYSATANSAIPMDNNQTIPSGSTINAISIWGTSGSAGSYVSLKGSGGEGVTDLGGALTWDATGIPETAIAWTENPSTVTIADAASTPIMFTMPAAITFNTATHADWLAWIDLVVGAADTAGFQCDWGPTDSAAHTLQGGAGALKDNIDCVSQVLEALTEDSVSATVPRVRLQSYCDQNGCLSSRDTVNDALKNYLDANAFQMARLEIEGINLNYPAAWANSDTNGTVAPIANDGIGIGPKTRFVFEPLNFFPNGAGFRQSFEDERRYDCLTSGGTVNNAICTGSDYFELVCYQREEMAIKFLGTAAPFDVLFDQNIAVTYAKLVQYGAGGSMTEITPTGTDALAMCSSFGQGGGTFFATATKQ